ncbi:hypothetical protein V4U86_26595 [Mycobacterium sp. AMU20-3851]
MLASTFAVGGVGLRQLMSSRLGAAGMRGVGIGCDLLAVQQQLPG